MERYTPNTLENMGNRVIQGLYVIYSVGVYASPVCVLCAYRWENAYTHIRSALKVCAYVGLLLALAYTVRGVGRLMNNTYMKFMFTLTKLQYAHRPSRKEMEILRKYDFEFFAWPVNFDVSDDKQKPLQPIAEEESEREKVGYLSLSTAYMLVSLVGRPLIYPGSVGILQYLIGDFLLKGREKLVREFNGERNKIQTQDGNSIDTIFIDRRNSSQVEGKKLVICCEGNAGFYEIGLITTPLDKGYSILGWNHPGFAGSNGQPYPQQERNAVVAVMQFATHTLGYKQQDILVYGWSIGGYTATYAARVYPKIAGLILDATFDCVLPLAVQRMPQLLSPIVNVAIKTHFNLNNAVQLTHYPGPVCIIRRTRDEIITTDENELDCNRSCNLLMSLLQSRFPGLLCNASRHSLQQYLAIDPSMQESLLQDCNVNKDQSLSLIQAQMNQSEPFINLSDEEKVPLLLFLASKYLVDFNSTHNNPLDPQLFNPPWTALNVKDD
ncbi:hypothetical protein Pcinc_028836 [Petrolisthes cinctipes]|uniref:Uncharacterized protein n=1 Tax=Petrolisthes cinctipes TaxID=88211 RepID=A0AAE1K8R1_PETCI|nr:hypothetical protein Pcinc_028836 [Petrolisthes cinctipes]